MTLISQSSKWADLAPRVGSAIAIAALAAFAVWSGGVVFVLFMALTIGLAHWELARLLGETRPPISVGIALFAGFAVLAAGWLMPPDFQPHTGARMPVLQALSFSALVLLISPIVMGAAMIQRHRKLYVAYSLLIMLGALGFLILGDRIIAIWLILVVIASDVAGYFFGRLLGGPKFWPRVSPKKTWSGTIAGWLAAGLIGLILFAGHAPLFWFVASVAIALAGQMGDIVESALKRKMGIKDSSNLIPGHGGVLDRFDAMIGAGAAIVVISLITHLL